MQVEGNWKRLIRELCDFRRMIVHEDYLREIRCVVRRIGLA